MPDSNQHSVLDLARGYAVPDAPGHINVLACEVVRLVEQFDAVVAERDQFRKALEAYADAMELARAVLNPAKERDDG